MVGVGNGADSQHAADGGDGGEEVDIVELWHMHVGENRGDMIKLRLSPTVSAGSFLIKPLTRA